RYPLITPYNRIPGGVPYPPIKFDCLSSGLPWLRVHSAHQRTPDCGTKPCCAHSPSECSCRSVAAPTGGPKDGRVLGPCTCSGPTGSPSGIGSSPGPNRSCARPPQGKAEEG